MGERRRSTRKKSFLRGCVYFNNRRSAIDCLIRDISDEGAKIIFSAAVSTPDQVDLYIPQKEQTLRARVQWRHGNEIGVLFPEIDAVNNASGGDAELAERVQKLEAEIATLKRLVKRLKTEVEGEADAA